MRKLVIWVLMIESVCALCASAQTQQSSSIGYAVVTGPGEVIEEPGGKKIRVGFSNHANIVGTSGLMAGQTASQWCEGMSMLDEAGAGATVSVGYCTLVFDNGDRLWVSFLNKPGQPGNWTVIGGTGRFEDATGSGSSSLVSQRGDGMAWTSQSKGTITTK